jgi:hypothetical protein
MSSNSIIAAIDFEIDRLQEARALLSSLDGGKGKAAVPNKTRTRRRLSAAARRKIAAAPAKKRARRKLSAAARKRIAAAQKKRWAATRAATKSAKAAPLKKEAKAPAKSAPRTKVVPDAIQTATSKG